MFTSLNTGALALNIPLDEALDLARDNGFAALDLPLAELHELENRSSAAAVKERFAAAGVRPGPWGLPVNFRTDEETYRAGLAELPAYAALAQELGSPWCATWILPFSDELDYAANMAFHAERLRPVARILAEHGCRFGLEFVGPATMRAGHAHEFIYTIAGALELAERIGTGNVGLLLDSYHWYTSHGTAGDLARLSAREVVYVHVNDAPAGRAIDEQLDKERALPGASGVIDLSGFLQALDRMGYDGPVAVEPFDDALTMQPPAERVRAAAASLHDIASRSGVRL